MPRTERRAGPATLASATADFSGYVRMKPCGKRLAAAFAFVRTSRIQVMSELEAVQDVLHSALKGRLHGRLESLAVPVWSRQVRSILEAAGGAK